jgi:hypothetical protein
LSATRASQFAINAFPFYRRATTTSIRSAAMHPPISEPATFCFAMAIAPPDVISR